MQCVAGSLSVWMSHPTSAAYPDASSNVRPGDPVAKACMCVRIEVRISVEHYSDTCSV